MVFRWLQLNITSPDVQASCGDLKVLGKGDFKNLLKWRTALREEVSVAFLFAGHGAYLYPQIGLEVKEKDVEDLVETAEVTDELDEEQQIRNEVCIVRF
jgi:AdoMet-dependent rRNA methyltransferase SPB1